MKIKIFRTLILLFVLVSSSSAQEKMFKIQFGLNIDSTTEAESVADIYLTKDYLRIENKFIDTSVQISDFKKQIAYILDYSNKNYYVQGLTTEDAVISPEDFQIEFIANASKSIAGYACKKAIIMAYDLELAPQVMELPKEFKDVGEIIEKDAKIWQEVSKKNIPALENMKD